MVLWKTKTKDGKHLSHFRDSRNQLRNQNLVVSQVLFPSVWNLGKWLSNPYITRWGKCEGKQRSEVSYVKTDSQRCAEASGLAIRRWPSLSGHKGNSRRKSQLMARPKGKLPLSTLFNFVGQAVKLKPPARCAFGFQRLAPTKRWTVAKQVVRTWHIVMSQRLGNFIIELSSFTRHWEPTRRSASYAHIRMRRHFMAALRSPSSPLQWKHNKWAHKLLHTLAGMTLIWVDYLG